MINQYYRSELRGRTCIRGPNCQRSCCVHMSKKRCTSQYTSPETSREVEMDKQGHTESSDSQTDDDYDENSRNSSSNGQGVDEVDATSKIPVQKSSSFPSNRRSPELPTPFSYGESLNGYQQWKSASNLYHSQKNIDRTENVYKKHPKTQSQFKLKSEEHLKKRGSLSPSISDGDALSGINISYVMYTIALAIVVGIACKVMWLANKNSEYTHSNFQDDLRRIVVEYEIRGDTLMKIQTAIKTTFKNEDTSSIVFFYSSMDEDRAKQIVSKIAKVTSKFLRNETNSASPIIVKTSDLNMDTSEELTWKYKRDLQDQGVLLFDGLEEIPVNLAMALHFYCDEFNPLVKKTAIFFTLNLSKCREKVGKTHHAMVESCLMDKWSLLHADKLPALLNRIVNVVVDLDTEENS